MMQQITLGGAMIALPLFLQMTLEYNAMEAGLSLAPLSLSMFGVALLAGQAVGKATPGQHRAGRVRAEHDRDGLDHPDRAASRLRMVAARPAADHRLRPGAPRVPAQQLHALAHRRRSGSVKPRA